jgi:hypothetical protein
MSIETAEFVNKHLYHKLRVRTYLCIMRTLARQSISIERLIELGKMNGGLRYIPNFGKVAELDFRTALLDIEAPVAEGPRAITPTEALVLVADALNVLAAAIRLTPVVGDAASPPESGEQTRTSGQAGEGSAPHPPRA